MKKPADYYTARTHEKFAGYTIETYTHHPHRIDVCLNWPLVTYGLLRDSNGEWRVAAKLWEI